MRLKQSNKLNNKLYLPPLKRIQSNQITPKNQYINHSLPKIPPNNLSELQSKLIPHETKLHLKKKKPLHERLKEMYNRKKDYSQYSTVQNKVTPEPIYQASITKRFQQEIQKNLMQIKKSKESYRKQNSKKILQRYQQPIKCSLFQEDNEGGYQKMRVATEQSVFSKINSIITTPKNYTIQTNRYLSFDSNQQPTNTQNIYDRHFRKKIKTEAMQAHFEQNKTKCQIKHNDNFHQWRKLSIDSLNDQNVKYEHSSYEIESERVQVIRNKNEVSLKKYLQSKQYLDKLITHRQSSMTLAKKE